MLVTGVTSVRP